MGSNKKEKGLVAFTSPVEVMTLLRDELNHLKAVTETSYRTSGNLEGFGDIKSEKKIENLIRAMSSVLGREKAYNEAADELGLAQYPAFSISGGNANDWKQDILLRIAVISHAERKAELEELLKEAESFMSMDDKKTLFMQRLSAKLQK